MKRINPIRFAIKAMDQMQETGLHFLNTIDMSEWADRRFQRHSRSKPPDGDAEVLQCSNDSRSGTNRGRGYCELGRCELPNILEPAREKGASEPMIEAIAEAVALRLERIAATSQRLMEVEE